MRKLDLIRAWKDPVYRSSLSAEERAQLPGHPSGIIEITDEHLQVTSGGTTTAPMCTIYTYNHFRYCCPTTA
ncbi:MAG TPA: mersacidin/lichenicidin family type 2 lantibiotic [Thermoanaerobaculia bacterium]